MTQSRLGTILLVCTSHQALGDTGHKTGFWMEELAAPYHIFKDAGYAVAIASPAGGNPPIDPSSLQLQFRTQAVNRFEADIVATAALKSSISLSDVAAMNAFEGIFLAGGHGTMWDFPENPDLARLLGEAASEDKAIGAVCHGVAGLLSVADGKFLEGRSVAGFSNDEEAAVGLTGVVPFLLQTRIEEKGARYSAAPAFAVHVQSDGRLVTGQNPASSAETARCVLKAMEA